MRYQFYTVLVLYVIHAIGARSTSYKTKQKVVRGRDDSVGVNAGRIVIAISPLIIWLYKVELSNQLLQIGFYAAGLAVWILSFTLFLQSRKTLMENFNSSPVIMDSHELIVDGYYNIIRHPIYTSYLMSWIGLTLITSNWIYSIVVACFVLRMLIRIKEEEKVLIQEFGEKYLKYKKETGTLFPKGVFWKGFLKNK